MTAASQDDRSHRLLALFDRTMSLFFSLKECPAKLFDRALLALFETRVVWHRSARVPGPEQGVLCSYAGSSHNSLCSVPRV